MFVLSDLPAAGWGEVALEEGCVGSGVMLPVVLAGAALLGSLGDGEISLSVLLLDLEALGGGGSLPILAQALRLRSALFSFLSRSLSNFSRPSCFLPLYLAASTSCASFSFLASSASSSGGLERSGAPALGLLEGAGTCLAVAGEMPLLSVGSAASADSDCA